MLSTERLGSLLLKKWPFELRTMLIALWKSNVASWKIPLNGG